MLTDPIADMLTRLRNAAKARHPRADMPASKMKIEIARILKEEGYISTFKVVDESKVRKTLRVFLKYTPDRKAIITDFKRVSRPGCRVYVGKSEIRPVVGGLGTSILTTPQGLMTGRAARKAGIGGEVLLEVW
jgi:small subunit ribosomal protein S8